MKRVILFSFSLWLALALFSSVFAQDVTRISASNTQNNTKTPFNPELATILRWDDGVNNNSLGLTAGGTFEAASYFDATIMTPLAGQELTQMELYVALMTGTVVAKIYDQGTASQPGALLYSEDITSQITYDVFSLVTLTTPVPITGNDLWIGYEVTHLSGEFPVGMDIGPMAPNGCHIYLSPGPWVTIQSLGFDINWNLAGYVEAASGGGVFPELIYYQFNEGSGTTTANLAVPGVGNNPASLTGGTIFTSPGQFGSAILGDFTANGGVETGWNVDLGTSDWTISMWLEIPTDPSGSAMYIFGDPGATSFRSFHNGIALPDNLVLRGGGMTDVFVNGIGPAPTVVTFVYDSSVPEIRTYKNGVFDTANPQPALNITGGTGFKVGGYSSSTIMQGKMDEFRFYNRALDSAEVANTWDIQIPVELTSFTASVDDNDVTLNWETASEINNSGFQIERKSTGEYQAIGFVPGFGTTTETKAYTFSDLNLSFGTYSYRLKQIDYDGTFEYSDPIEVNLLVPDVYSLHQNYPNPFNPSTKITFTIAANALVTLKVFDVLGQEVMTLINQDLTAGVHTYDFDAAGFNSGVYFYRIEANGIDGTNFTNVKKMILLK